MKRLIPLLILISYSAHAFDAPHIKKGDISPADGYVVSSARAEELYLASVNATGDKRILALTQDENAILAARLNNAQAEIKTLSEKDNSSSLLHDILPFAAGILTTIAVYSVVKVTK